MADWYSKLGVKRPEASGGQGQEVAAPATTGGKEPEVAAPAESGQTQEVADPAQDLDTSAVEDPTGAEAGAEGDEPGADSAAGADGKAAKELTDDERRENARLRREAERRELEERIRADESRKAQALVDSAIAMLRLRMADGSPVTTKAEYEKYVAEKNKLDIEAGLSQTGIDRGVIDAIIESHPDVTEARRIAIEAAAEKERGQTMSAEARAAEQLALIQQDAPHIKSMDDLRAMPTYEKLYALVRDKGLSISDAYFVANRDDIRRRDKEAAKQEAVNLAAGKSHLEPDTPRGSGGAPSVPANIKDQYRKMYGNKISDKEIQQKYERYLKQIRKDE